MYDAKNLTLNIYEADHLGKPIDYSITAARQPKDDCISVIISLKESMQVEKLRIQMSGLKPQLVHAEPLLEIKEGEFGLELVEPLLIEVSESADES